MFCLHIIFHPKCFLGASKAIVYRISIQQQQNSARLEAEVGALNKPPALGEGKMFALSREMLFFMSRYGI